MKRAIRTVLVAALALTAIATPLATPPAPAHRDITYILPLFPVVPTPQMMSDFTTSIGEGPYVKTGFSSYVVIDMMNWTVDIHDPAAVRAALVSTFAEIDANIAHAVTLGVPWCMNMVTRSRDAVDPVQTASGLEDRRSMQWHMDNSVAAGWWSHSRYARKARAIQEAYIREVGRYLARKMNEYPDTLVSVAGDGEVEMSYEKSSIGHPGTYTEANSQLADYSPFAVAEFRDWLRNGGLYASPAGSYAGEGYAQAARYHGDLTPGTDEGGDGHTLNGDFGTTFADWNLRIGEWELTDDVAVDPNRLPPAAPLPAETPNGFDAPRTRVPGNAWWEVWYAFRQAIITHHVKDFSKWITTSAYPDDSGGGVTVPSDRWYSYQIPADYLFGGSPATPNFRFVTSASPLLSADVFPNGGMGITSFNINQGANGPYARTLAGALPVIEALHRRWAILEWNPSVPASTSPGVYRDDMVLIERYRPGVLTPFLWDDLGETKGTPFESELSSLVQRIKNVPAGCSYSIPSARTVGAAGASGQSLNVAVTTVSPLTDGQCPWTATSDAAWLQVATAAGIGDGAVSYTIAANNTSTARVGRITVAGFTFTVSQREPHHVAGDFSGDGHADLAVFSPGSGNWSIQGQAVRQWGLPGDVPVPGDYDGDTIEDVAVYRPVTGQWYINGQATRQNGRRDDIPVPADYDGDGKTDAGVYRYAFPGAFPPSTNFVLPIGSGPGNLFVSLGAPGFTPVPADYDGDGKADPAVFRSGLWEFKNSTTNYNTTTSFGFGVAGDAPVPRDYDGDGKADVAVYRPSTGQWFMVLSASNTTVVYTWGLAGDQPVPQDVDGDGADELVVFRPSDGTWWIFNRVAFTTTMSSIGATGDMPSAQRPRLPSVVTDDADGDGRADMTVFRPSDGVWYTRLSGGNFDTTRGLQWGLAGDAPVPGDYDGDRIADVAVYRPAGGLWFIRYSATGFTTTRTLQWGLAGDLPHPADYDGDGRTDVAVYRPSSGEWFVLQSSTQYTTFTVTQWGLTGDLPLPADYDGDGRADFAIYRPAGSQWYFKLSTGVLGGAHMIPFGAPGDVPVTRDFNGDGRADLAVFRPSTNQWLTADLFSPTVGPRFPVKADTAWGAPGDVPVPHDFDGDRAADFTIFRPSTGEWFALLSPSAIYRQWGLFGDLPQ